MVYLQVSGLNDREAKDLFRGRSEYYNRSRPGYPPSLINLLRDRISFSPSWNVADIGSGTGILSKLFLSNGNTVFGVEPNEEMRAVSVSFLGEYHDFHPVSGAGEQTGLEDNSVDLISCGQSFHWFDTNKAAREFKRILKPEGYVVLVWNDRLPGDKGINAEYEKICASYSPKYHSSGSTVLNKEGFGAFFSRGYEEHALGNFQNLDLDGLKGRYLSASYAISHENERYSELMNSLEEAFRANETDGYVRIEYETRVFLGQI